MSKLIQKDTLKSKGTKAFIWNFLGKIATQGMSFIVLIFLARLLEPSEFGLIAMVMVIIGIASVFTDVGLGGALIQRRRVLPVHYSSVFYFNILIGSILTVLTYFSAGWIGEFYHNDELTPLAEVMSLSFIINAFGSVPTTKLRKNLNYAALTKVSFIASLLSGGIGIFLAYFGYGVWSLVAQTLSMGIIYNILIGFVSRWRPSFLFSFKALTQLWGFGFRMFLSGLLDAVFTRLDYLIIGKLFTPLTLGFFQRAKSLNLNIVQLWSGSLMAVLFPVLSKIQNDLPRFQRVVQKTLGIICFITFLILGVLYLVSEELIVLLFGDKWLPSVPFFNILVLSGFGFPVGVLMVNVLSSRGNSKAFLRLEILKKILASVNFLVLYAWGIGSYLYGLIVVSIFGVLINIFFASREIKLSMFRLIEPVVDQAVITAVAVVTASYIMIALKTEGELLLISKGLLFITIYFLSNLLLKTQAYRSFTEEAVSMVKQRL